MINLASSSMDLFAESAIEIATGISTNAPIIGNVALCMDNG
jgi:hypothetical protein